MSRGASAPGADAAAVVSGPARCLVCDQEPPFEGLFARGGWKLVRCPRCGLVFQDPQPDDAVLERAYYHDPEFSEALFGAYREWTLEQARLKLRLLEATAGELAPGRALDVGCSSGAWLEVSAKRGWRATGIEPGAQTAAAARERGLDVRTGTLEALAPTLAGEQFDLITYWDVLEHLRDPRRELELAATLLAPDGVLAATMPNVAGWYPRLTYRLLARRTGVWEYPELPVHLYDFSPATVRRLFERSGYRVLGVRTSPVPYRFYRATTLSGESLGGGARGQLLRGSFALLRAVVYPLARAFDRSNSLAVAARRAAVPPAG
jgi:SAM-dependent methyltransferase